MKIYRGNIFYCKSLSEYDEIENGFLIVDEDGRIVQVCSVLPEEYEKDPVINCGNNLIIPSFCDIHLHSAQFVNTGLGYHLPFEDWLTLYTYPAERQYRDIRKAEQINRRLIHSLWKFGTMNAAIMGSTDALSTYLLMKQLSESGMSAYIGKMNADMATYGNEAEDTDASIRETIDLIERARRLSGHVVYCISPEFVPNCSDELLKRLGELAVEYNLPVQSHMSEGETDTEIVKTRYGDLSYGKVYDIHRFFGQTTTIMAHAIYATKEEQKLMKKNGVTLAFCPVAISNIPSGKPFALSDFLYEGVNVGLGSDIGGGHTLNMMRIIVSAVHYSKFQQFFDHSKPLSVIEAYALATVGGGKVFGKVGSFRTGYYFDALVIDDEELSPPKEGYSVKERVERFLYEGDYHYIKERYCRGKLIKEPEKN